MEITKKEMYKRRFEVFDADNNSHEYFIVLDEDKKEGEYSLHHSSNGVWSEHVKSKRVCKITGDGDLNIEASFCDGDGRVKKSIKLDCSQMEELRILLNTRANIERNTSNWEVVEVKNVIKF